MLEIVILIILAGTIGKIAEKKGRKKLEFQCMLVALWIVGEILGALLGFIIAPSASIHEGGRLLLAFFALGGGITGAVIAFQIAKHAKSVESQDDYYQGIDYADQLRAGEHFGERVPAAPPMPDTITKGGDKAARPVDERIQE